MATIGHFTETNVDPSNGRKSFEGEIRTLTLNLYKVLIRSRSDAPAKHPQAPTHGMFVVASDGTEVEIAAGWAKVSDTSGGDYVSFKIDDPTLPAPIYANLYERPDGSYGLLWHRK